MPNFILNFNNQDYELTTDVVSDTNFGYIDETYRGPGDYIRLIIKDNNGNMTNYISMSHDQSINTPAVFYSSNSGSNFTIQIPGKLENSYIRNVGTDLSNNFKIYKTPGDDTNFYIKADELLATSSFTEGNYNLQIDFLNQYHPVSQSSDGPVKDAFLIRQISPSRKEVRLKLLENNITNADIESNDGWLNNIGSVMGDPYQFNHVLHFGNGFNIPIVNYAFDRVSTGRDNQSLILKLYEAIPSDIRTLQTVTIEKEVLITQTQPIYYFTDAESEISYDGLNIDYQQNWVNPQIDSQFMQDHDALTSSLELDALYGIYSGSVDDYPNLNTNFNFFENHTFFGSAKRKLVNFKNKIQTIQGHYSDISNSFSASGVRTLADDSGLVEYRKILFDKVQSEIDSFTPYERFLYYDGQNQSTASAPGVGKNYADTYAINKEVGFNLHTSSILNKSEYFQNKDGFPSVYKVTSSLYTNASNPVQVFTNKYRAEQKPFHNYSQSVYLSFMVKGDESWKAYPSGAQYSPNRTHDSSSYLNHEHNSSQFEGFHTPADSIYRNFILSSSLTGSEYRRYIIHASASYWKPTGVTGVMFDAASVSDFSVGSDQVEVLSGSIKTGSANSNTITTDGAYSDLATVVTQSNVPFSGSIMPNGDLFNMFWLGVKTAEDDADPHSPTLNFGSTNDASATSSYFMDVKVTLKNPLNVLPFDSLYHTSSTEWTSWYDGMYDSASAFDTDNINSLENNLPTYIKQSSEYEDLKKFLSLIGEQYDVIRNHIDQYETFHNRNYNKLESVPGNLLPMLLDNMGWEAISPFTSSLAGYFGKSLSSVTNIKDITENTWRKVLNNLVYIYKSKGTKNSIRALLNSYGYPPDVIDINEFGGSNIQQNDVPISPLIPTMGTTENDTNLSNNYGNISYHLKSKQLYHYRFDSNSRRILNFDWWMDNAEPNSVEFVYRHRGTKNTQTILKSSGSASEHLWDLILIPSTAGVSSSFRFRLNNTRSGSSAIASNAVSMSTDYVTMTDGQLWNVILQRMSSSVSGSGTNEYHLAVAKQDGSKISNLTFTSMSISGGLTRDGNFEANENWLSTGSRHADSASNLFVGETTSGSLSEIRAWKYPLSMSKFRLHTLNKFSTVGNTISSHKNDLIYHFRLNENHLSSSLSSSAQTTLNIVDSNPKGPETTPTDYTFTISSDVATGSILYGYDIIETNTISLQDINQERINDNNVIIKPDVTPIDNLNPFTPSVKFGSNVKDLGERLKRTNSTKLEINRSPQDFVNNFIMDKIQGFNLEKLYANPNDLYSASYEQLDSFRQEFYDTYDIKIDINKFIRAHENIFNLSVVEGIKSLIPARSTLSDFNSSVGVTIKPTILEKPKVEFEKSSVTVNPDLVTGSINITSRENYKSGFSTTSSYELPKSASISVVNDYIVETGSYILPKSASISVVDDYIIKTVSYDLPKSASISVVNDYIIQTASYDLPKSTSLAIVDDYIIQTGSYFLPKSGSIKIHNTHDIQNNHVSITSSYALPKSASIAIHSAYTSSNFYLVQTASINLPKSVSISIPPSTTGSDIITPISGTNNYIQTHYNASFTNIHDSWGTASNDVHFLNMGTLTTQTSSDGNYNVNHIEPRYHFYMIGDVEIYSGSLGNETEFTDATNFHNRQNITEYVHSEITYDSYIHGNPGTQTGRAIGKTRFYSQSLAANGNVTEFYPSNHFTKFSNPWTNQMYAGAQNINPGIMNIESHKDYSTASFYSITVTGENILKVQRQGE